MAPVKRAVVIVAHPRSGTHITLDFIRRNFPVFNPSLFIWQSARELYVSLDLPEWRERLLRHAQRSDHLLMQSHLAGFQNFVGLEAVEYLQPEHAVFIYPFRRYSATMKSLAEFCKYSGRVDDFLSERSTFFGTEWTVEACAHRHAERWMERNPVFLDVDALIARPDHAAEKLADVMGVTAAPLERRLPHRRIFHGKLAEAVQRLTGRESTEVRVPFQRDWSNSEEPARIDGKFAPLYRDLSGRSVI